MCISWWPKYKASIIFLSRNSNARGSGISWSKRKHFHFVSQILEKIDFYPTGANVHFLGENYTCVLRCFWFKSYIGYHCEHLCCEKRHYIIDNISYFVTSFTWQLKIYFFTTVIILMHSFHKARYQTLFKKCANYLNSLY